MLVMLVLTRKKNEAIVVADGEITITVLEIRGDKVRLGLSAAKDIPIHRKEVYDAIQRESAAVSETPLEK
jgi:carbon storage regulator